MLTLERSHYHSKIEIHVLFFSTRRQHKFYYTSVDKCKIIYITFFQTRIQIMPNILHVLFSLWSVILTVWLLRSSKSWERQPKQRHCPSWAVNANDGRAKLERCRRPHKNSAVSDLHPGFKLIICVQYWCAVFLCQLNLTHFKSTEEF